MSSVVTERTIECQSDVCTLWTAITDTERMNRAVGMDRISLAPIEDGTAARYLVTTRLGGFKVQYEERPFEWLYPQSFKVLRKMRSGPLRALEMGWALRSTPAGGSTVTLRLTLTPRFAFLAPLLRFLGGQTARALERAVSEFDAASIKHEPAPAAERSEARAPELARARTELLEKRPNDHELVERFVTLIRDASDIDVARIRPFELADTWKEDRRRVLSVCLASVRAGLLELRWEVVCPSCRTATDVLPTLSSLSDHGACQLCEIQFAIDLEEAVEATFGPAPAVRTVDTGPYCVGGPARTPHVLSQAILPPNGEATLVAPSEEGRFRLFVRGGAAALIDVVKDANAEENVRSEELAASKLRVAPDGALHITNESSDERHVKLERVTWADQAAKAHFVTTMPGFRRDFSNDILRPGTALKIARVGIFFSDLTGSTQLYTTAGDAAAFKLVQDHFDVVIRLIEQGHGTLVKTIGDAVMAVFSDDVDGVATSLQILAAFDEFRKHGEHRDRTHIKLGVFGGPCYVVTANAVLDYFGQTVNISARLQNEAKSGELVIETDLADRAIARGVLDEADIVERYDARLKGVDNPVAVARIRPRAYR